MGILELFPSEQIIGVFRGFSKGGLEFHADLVLPYRHEFQSIPMHGQFLLVQLETHEEAVLGRITSLSSAGKLSSGVGEEFNIRAVREGRPVPEDLREQYLKYQVDIRVLGVLRKNPNGDLTFVASHRRLPHVGSPVAFLSGEVLREIAGHNVDGAEIGHLALGEYIYAQNSDKIAIQNWMQIKAPETLVKFPISNLVSRRSFIFARAGFGKSNLNKLLFSKLYEETPTVTKRGGREVPVGTVLFDPEGEYFWPDDKGRPGLCDVPALEDKLVVFTNRKAPSDFYQSFVAGGIRLDIRRLKPGDVISIAINPERQSQQNIRKLRGLSQAQWEELVDLIHQHGHQTLVQDLKRILRLEQGEEVQAFAARANMTTIVKMLHDPSSQLMDRLIKALSRGKLCVVDVSQMRSRQSLILSGLILRRIFDRNQQEFTAAEPKTIPTIAVVEEAQAVLNEKATGAEPYIAWVKEGRKYDLGAVLVTQQPGSIPTEILSQGDNWFIFHLLSAADLSNVRKANAHFSEDILSTILNEPIPGQGVFWSSASGKPFPVAIRVLSFEEMYSPQDPDYNKPAANAFARELKGEFEESLQQVIKLQDTATWFGQPIDPETGEMLEEEPIDQLRVLDTFAVNVIQSNQETMAKLRDGTGLAWGSLKAQIKNALPETVEDRDNFAYYAVAKAMNELFGPQDEGWETYRFERNGKFVTYVRAKQ
jgi:DNA helicase HerA-like ATPase